jgi:hypothetical protein
MGLNLPIAYSEAHVTPVTTIKRTQRLPHGSGSKVAVGQMVKAMDVLAVSETPDERKLIDVAKVFKVDPEQVDKYLKKHAGDVLHAGDVIAERRSFLGLRKKRISTPVDGRIAWAGDGKVLVEGGTKRIEVLAAAPGRILTIEPGEYIVIETHGAVIEVAWGNGGLVWATLKVMDTMPSFNTDAGRFNIDHRASIVAIASPLTEQFLKEAEEIRVKGIIASSMHASLIPLVKKIDFPVAITQGFGQHPMSERILSMLNTHNGREIAMDMGQGVTNRDSRENRPEIIIPVAGGVAAGPAGSQSTERAEQHTLRPGERVRILQNPYMGEIGTVTEIPQGPRKLESGLWLAGAMVEVGSATRPVFVPFANLQQLG